MPQTTKGRGKRGRSAESKENQKLPNVTACENGLAGVIALLPDRRNRRQDRELRVPKVVTDLAMAEEFQRLLDAGEARNRADLARCFRLTRARVTQLMNLLKLDPLILAYVKSLPLGTPTKQVTERGLRTLVRLAVSKQVPSAKKMLRGFLVFARSHDRTVTRNHAEA